MSGDPVILTDSRGRKLTVKDLSAIEQMRLLRAIGPDQSMNQPYVMAVQAAASVASIDGVPCPKPNSERQIDAMVERLGDEGLAVVQLHQQVQMAKAYRAAQEAFEAQTAEASTPDPLAASAS
ncbi:MAG: hypothetical protein ACRYG8_03460 [Janthinobacterium lividum]